VSPDTARRLALTLGAAALDVLGFAGFGFFPLTWVALVPALVVIRGQTPGRAAGYGLLLGTAANLGGYYWIAHMLTEFGGLPRPVAWAGLLLLCAYQGIAFALLLWAVRRAESRLGLAPLWSLAVVYPAVELAYPLVFPYSIGASQYRFTAITQVVEVTGLLGLTALIGLVNGALYELVDAGVGRRRPSAPRLAVTALLFLAVLAYGLVRIPSVEGAIAAAPRIKVALVQTNLGARDKDADPALFIARHQAMSRAALAEHPDLDLLVWPETAYNRWLPKGLSNPAIQAGPGLDRPMIWGALTYRRHPDGRVDTFNTAFLTAASGEVLGSYDKVELVLFGERIPLVHRFPVIRGWFPRSSTFTPGETLAHLRLGELTFLPMICYEDILPAFVRRFWQAAGPASVLVNLTNDSWYGDSHEPLIHLALATFRSIETRRALVRSTNTGISALVDPLGRITARSGQWRQELVVGEVPVIAGGGSTPYMRVGDLVGWLAWAGVLAGAVADRRRGRRRAGRLLAPDARGR
jgi:apolipoprotein N-acyltransferase